MLVILETEKNCEFSWPDGDIVGKDDNYNSIADHQNCNSNIEECLYLAPCNEDEWYDCRIGSTAVQLPLSSAGTTATPSPAPASGGTLTTATGRTSTTCTPARCPAASSSTSPTSSTVSKTV